MASFRIKLDARQVERAFRALGRRAQRMRPAWEEVGEILQRSVRKNFDEQGRPRRWPPLSPATLKRRRKGPKGAKALIDTERLMNSITRIASDSDVEVGTNVIYANTHQHGRGNIPARPFLLIQSEDEPRIVRAVEEYIGRPLL